MREGWRRGMTGGAEGGWGQSSLTEMMESQ